MSLILEALRKSEAERRLGRAPDLLAAMPVLHAPAPRSRWPMRIAGICVVIAAIAMGWWWMRAMPNAQQESASAPSLRSASHRDTGIGTTRDAANNAPHASIAMRKSQPPVITLPVTSAPHPIAPITAAPAHQSVVAAPKPATMPAPIQASRDAAPPKLAVEVPVPAQSNIAITSATPTPAPATAPPADEPALLSLAELSASERIGLPTLKVSMYVYAEDPAQRFMIVDGQHVGEGARLADGVTLVRIRRDGAEIDAHGRRLLLPKP